MRYRLIETTNCDAERVCINEPIVINTYKTLEEAQNAFIEYLPNFIENIFNQDMNYDFKYSMNDMTVKMYDKNNNLEYVFDFSKNFFKLEAPLEYQATFSTELLGKSRIWSFNLCDKLRGFSDFLEIIETATKERSKKPSYQKEVEIIADLDGKEIVYINKNSFKGENIDWKKAGNFIKNFIGKSFTTANGEDIIYIGKELPKEFIYSGKCIQIKHNNKSDAKAKANASKAIPELIEISTTKKFTKNMKEKHNIDAHNGWYKFKTRFAIPKLKNDNTVAEYKIYKANLLVRHDANGKLYLYDVIDVR